MGLCGDFKHRRNVAGGSDEESRITHRILRLLNGKMEIRSENGVITVVVSLPLYLPNPGA